MRIFNISQALKRLKGERVKGLNFFASLPLYLFTLLPLYLLSSCSEEIDIQLRSGDVRLVVEGGIGIDTTVHTVILSTTIPYFSTDIVPPYVSGAHVTITEFDSNEQQIRVIPLTEHPTKKGHYQTAPDIDGKQRHTYRLDIILNENIGGQTHYIAEAYFPPIADRIDSIRAVWGQNILFLLLTGMEPNPNSIRTGWNIEVFAKDPPGDNFYLLVVYKNGVPLNDTLTRLLLLDNQMISQNNIELEGLPMAFVSDSSWMAVKQGDIIELEIRGVSEEYYRYIHEFGNVYGGTNPMFGGAPANVRGNVKSANGNAIAIGYFWAHGNRRASDVADRSKKPTFEFDDWRWPR